VALKAIGGHEAEHLRPRAGPRFGRAALPRSGARRAAPGPRRPSVLRARGPGSNPRASARRSARTSRPRPCGPGSARPARARRRARRAWLRAPSRTCPPRLAAQMAIPPRDGQLRTSADDRRCSSLLPARSV
jgi:hypothetical protein